MYHKYPYTDFHEMNMDWFINKFKELLADWEENKPDYNKLYTDVKDYVSDYFKTNIDPLLYNILSDPSVWNDTEGYFKLTAIYFTNQCDCYVLQTGDKVYIIDTGLNNDATDTKIKATLTELGVTKVDGIIISHFDIDHCGGLLNGTFDDYMTSETLFYFGCEVPSPLGDTVNTYRNECIGIAEQYGGMVDLTEGYNFNVNGLTFTFYNTFQQANYTNYINNYSLCTHVTNGSKSILFTADIDYRAQAYLATKIDHVTLATVPHHGINHFINIDFVNAASPEYCIASTNDVSRLGAECKVFLDHGVQTFVTAANSKNITIEGVSNIIAFDADTYSLDNKYAMAMYMDLMTIDTAGADKQVTDSDLLTVNPYSHNIGSYSAAYLSDDNIEIPPLDNGIIVSDRGRGEVVFAWNATPNRVYPIYKHGDTIRNFRKGVTEAIINSGGVTLREIIQTDLIAIDTEENTFTPAFGNFPIAITFNTTATDANDIEISLLNRSGTRVHFFELPVMTNNRHGDVTAVLTNLSSQAYSFQLETTTNANITCRIVTLL